MSAAISAAAKSMFFTMFPPEFFTVSESGSFHRPNRKAPEPAEPVSYRDRVECQAKLRRWFDKNPVLFSQLVPKKKMLENDESICSMTARLCCFG